jgi:hypothetical protein
VKREGFYQTFGVSDVAVCWGTVVPLLNHYSGKVCGGVEVQLHRFLISALDGGDGSTSLFQLYCPSESVWTLEFIEVRRHIIL